MKTQEEICSALSMLYSRRDVYTAEAARGELASQSMLDDIWGKIYGLRWVLDRNIQWGVDFKPQEEGEGAFKAWPLSSYCYPGCEVPTEPAALPVGQEHYPPLVSTSKVLAVIMLLQDKALGFSAFARQQPGVTVLSERVDYALDDTDQQGPPIVRFTVAAERADDLIWLGLHAERARLVPGSFDSLTAEEHVSLMAARLDANSLQAIVDLRKLATPGFWQPGDEGILAVVSYEADGETQSSAKLVTLSPQNQYYICRMHNVLPRLEAQLREGGTQNV